MRGPAHRRQVAAGAAHRGRIDVGRVHGGPPAERGGQRGAQGARAAAQVHHQGGGRGQLGRPLDEELRAAARHEHAVVDGHPQAAERGPADDVLQRVAAGPARHHGVQLVGRAGGGEEQRGLLLREHAARRAEAGGEGVGRDQAVSSSYAAGSESWKRRNHASSLPPSKAPIRPRTSRANATGSVAPAVIRSPSATASAST